MPLERRIFQGSADWLHMSTVIQARPESHLHVVDLPYRLCSWAFDDPANCVLWHDRAGQVLAWAMFQPPFWSIDYAIHPQAPVATLTQILEWADQRASALQGTPFARPCWFINSFAGQHEQELEAAEFHSQANVGEDSWTKVLFRRDTLPLAHARPLPAGFQIRPLNGAAEVDQYVALHRAVFQSENMTSEWRRRTLTHPGYLPQLDLVISDAGGQLAGFCIGWYTAHGPQRAAAGQIEPIGIRADVQHQGLGRALLHACLEQLAALGAASVFVETDNYRDAAFNFYSGLSFQIVHDVIVYRKDYPTA